MESPKEKLVKKISLKVVAVVVLFLVCMFFFGFIADEAVLEKEDVFDANVHSFFRAHTTPAVIHAMRSFTFFGSSYFLFPAYIVLILVFIFRKRYRFAIDIAIVALSSFGVMQILKRIFHRHRPDMPIVKGITSYSFPSGHALSSFIFCSILSYIVWRQNIARVYKWLFTCIFMLLALTIAVSRIVLNVHFATDVLASFCLGIMWVIISFYVINAINRRRPA